MWESLCEVIGRTDLRDDERLKGRKARNTHRQEIWTQLEAEFLKKPALEWVQLLLDAEIPVGTVSTLDETLNDPQVLQRGMVKEMHDSAGHAVKVAGNPIKIKGLLDEPTLYPPHVGEHTREVLKKTLGLSDQAVDELTKAGIVSHQRSQDELSKRIFK
jgi:crotonobetainyl-CoA:carnitine CoA-transferase CaiB-like acyl-CoA transferase